MAIKTDRTLWSWGNNYFGQLGLNDTVFRSSPVQIGAGTDWSKISANQRHSLAIKTTGTLWAWGNNEFGRLGDGTIISRSSPVQIGALTTWSSVCAGYTFSGAIKTDGTLWVWGYNDYGQLGQNDNVARSSPVQVGALTTWSQLGSMRRAFCAITTGGTLFTWGSNYFGELGINLGYVGQDRSSPVQVGNLTNWSKVKGLNLGVCVAVKTDGTLWTWGRNQLGQLGLNDAINRSSPVQVGALTDWSIPFKGYNSCCLLYTSPSPRDS